jgi:mannose-6-phosphate isomerase-like protein (cupin superfamily)
MELNVINLQDKLDLIHDLWTPRVIAELNGQQVKISKVKGEFVWHDHKHEDELFFIIKGKLKIEFRDRVVEINAGEMIVVPMGVEHRPVAEEEVWMMLFEPSQIKHTGDVESHLTVATYEKI